jgi:hypothetical protein
VEIDMDKEVASASGIGIVSTLAGYCELLNPILTACIGLASFIFICSKIYWLWKNKGKIDD